VRKTGGAGKKPSGNY